MFPVNYLVVEARRPTRPGVVGKGGRHDISVHGDHLLVDGLGKERAVALVDALLVRLRARLVPGEGGGRERVYRTGIQNGYTERIYTELVRFEGAKEC